MGPNIIPVIIFLTLALLLTTVAGSPYQHRINAVLNIFENCYTDVIFSKTVFDVAPPEYPILISTPQEKHSVTPSTIRKEECISPTGKKFSPPEFKSVNGTPPQPIQVRLNCVALVLLNANSARDIQNSFRNRHNWIHLTSIDLKNNSQSLHKEDKIAYSGNLYINVVSEQSFEQNFIQEPIWPASEILTFVMHAIYFWSILTSPENTINLKINLNPPCSGSIFSGNVALRNMRTKKLNRIFALALQEECQNLLFWLNLKEHVLTNEVSRSYYGPPLPLSTLIYPSDQLSQVLFLSAPFSIAASAFKNCTILSAPHLGITTDVDDTYTSAMVDISKKPLGPLVLLISETSTPKTLNSAVGFIPTRITDLLFMNCKIHEISLDFQAYLKPFQNTVWLFLITILGVCTGFIFLLLRKSDIIENGFLLLYSFLLEHAYHMQKQLLELKAFKIFLAVFLLMGIVLTTGFKGVVVTDITAPLKEHQIATFQEASEKQYSIITSENYADSPVPLKEWHFYKIQENPQISLYDFTLLKYPRFHLSNTFLDKSVAKTLQNQTGRLSRAQGELYNSISRMMVTWWERGKSILEHGIEYEFLKCNKTIWVDSSDELRGIYFRLSGQVQSNITVSLTRPKDGILSQPWFIENPGQLWDNGLLVRRLKALSSSGILNKMKEMELWNMLSYHVSRNARSKQPRPMNMDSNILTLFVIYLIGIAMTVMLFITEKSIVFVSSGQLRASLHRSIGFLWAITTKITSR